MTPHRMSADLTPEIIDHLLGAYLSGFISGVATRGVAGCEDAADLGEIVKAERALAKAWADRICGDPLTRSAVADSLVAAWFGRPLPASRIGPVP